MADDANPDDGDVSESTGEADAAVTGQAEDVGGATTEGSAAAEPESTAVEVEATDTAAADSDADDADNDAADDAAEDDEALAEGAEPPAKKRMSHVSLALIAGLVAVLALGGVTGWLGQRAYESHKAEAQRQLFLQVGRQGALNLTTIDWQHAEADVQRVLDSATGQFYDDFQNRSQPFIAVVKQAQSKSIGTVTEAGLESESGDEGRVLVAVAVQTSNAGAPDQQPRAWRMRITVKKDGDDNAKVSNVEFVP